MKTTSYYLVGTASIDSCINPPSAKIFIQLLKLMQLTMKLSPIMRQLACRTSASWRQTACGYSTTAYYELNLDLAWLIDAASVTASRLATSIPIVSVKRQLVRST